MRLHVVVHKLNHIAWSNREIRRQHAAERRKQRRGAKTKRDLPVLDGASSVRIRDGGRRGDANY